VQYCASREGDLGPVGPEFGRARDQIDRADAVLSGLRDRVRQGIGQAEPGRPDADVPGVDARASQESGSRLVTLSMDEATANIAIFAYAVEREAHVREVEQFAQGLPEGSYGGQNRQAISAREMRAAARLRP
jgi:hypothetical protein